MIDEIQQLVDDARERLLKKYGGFEGYWDHLLREEARRVKAKKSGGKKKAGKPARRKRPARHST